ncbi:MAG TPA: DUF5832 domain-containing protein [Nitrosarchaeum sp.]|nr:DUF5832 domain-containing protein [Nitrosarchaeum sp.]
MQTKPVDPYYPSLSPAETKAACEKLVQNCCPEGYTAVVRTDTDPQLVGQQIGLVSFNLFETPRKLQTGKNVYGFMKLRGNYPDDNSAVFEAAKIIREIDSKNQIKRAPVGRWVPITDELAFIKDFLDVNVDKKDEDTQVHIRDDIAKEKQKQESQMIRELREREEECKNSGDMDDEDHLDCYTKNMVSLDKILEQKENVQKKLLEVEKNLEKITNLLKKSDVKHPQYRNGWLENYNAARRKIGVSNFEIPERMEIYCKYNLNKDT